MRRLKHHVAVAVCAALALVVCRFALTCDEPPATLRAGYGEFVPYISTDDPDSLYTEFVGREVPVHRELANTSDGLRAFEITDNSGYVLCFGRPANE